MVVSSNVSFGRSVYRKNMEGGMCIEAGKLASATNFVPEWRSHRTNETNARRPDGTYEKKVHEMVFTGTQL